LTAYRQSYKLQVSDSLKALALTRVARCLQKMKQVAEAEQAYHTILEQYGDLYDPFHRPYAIIAGLELNDLAITQKVSSPLLLVDLYNDLVQGRWELSAEQMDYFLARLKEPVKEPPNHETEYLNHLELARALQESFRHQGPLQPNQVYASAVTRGEKSYQIFYTPLPSGSGEDHLLGFAVDLNWVESELLSQCRSELEMDRSFGIAFKTTKSEFLPRSPSEVIVAFKTLFPLWELSVVKTQQTIFLRETLVFVGAILLVLCVLGLGVFLLIRDASREMQLARLRGDFVSNVSHELKTPLTLIRLYGEMLLYGQNLREEERKSYYQIITGEGERLTHLVEKVLDFSRIDRGLKKYNLKEGDLAPVVGRTVEVYRQYLIRQGFSIETDLVAELPPVRFDSEAISQAVLNLMDNAARYSGQSKFIGIRLSCKNNKVIFEVEDHGPGITASERPKIFDQFYRGPSSAGKSGYGLGLFLVKHIMDAHGGNIELESEVGGGSRFRLIFPVSFLGTEPKKLS
jgi:signal transduction histidine kinase